MVETLKMRVRLLFANNILTKTQKKDGLKRSWLLLKPQLESISDLVFYIMQSFDLHDSCPHGIILHADGFVLPEFESTNILSDKDVISVKKKEPGLLDADKANEGANICTEDNIVEKQPLPSCVKLLANEEFDKGPGGCQSATDNDEGDAENGTLPLQTVPSGDVASKKRKACSKIKSPKKKRQRLLTSGATQKRHVTTPKKKKKHGNESKQEAVPSPDATEKRTNDVETKSITCELVESEEHIKQASNASDAVKKASRSTLRKRKKRHFKALSNKAKVNEIQQLVKDVSTNSGLQIDIAANCTQESDASDAEGDLVPVVIRPGHIRFTRSGKEKDVLQNQEPNGLEAHQNGAWDQQPTSKNVSDVKHKQVEEPYYWNGVTSKRKGQKWGQEKQSTSSWKESRDRNSHSSIDWGASKQATPSWKASGDVHSPSSWKARKHPFSDGKGSRDCNSSLSNNNYANFDNLVPLTDSPVVGDIVAYRLLELSSSWCPELSSFRVGKITSFEPESNKIILVPVPEYPLNLGKRPDGAADDDDDDFDGQPPASSVYNEDGSLETDFSSLNDVRILKRGELTQPEVISDAAANGVSATSSKKRNEAQVAGKNVVSTPSKIKQIDEALGSGKNVASDVGNQEPDASASANGQKDPWEEISDAILAKKAQLSVEDAWNKKESSAKRTWSYRTLRGSGIGATMARLRAQNGV